MKQRSLVRWLITAVAGGLFLYISLTVADPDFGWHIRLGEIIRENGVPKTDPFTYTMRDYPFVDYEWGTNLAWYLVYSAGGLPILAVIYTCMALAVPFIAIPENNGNNWPWAAVLIWTVMLSRFAVRPQVITWLFLAIVVRWIWDKKTWLRYRWWYPPLMLLWTNLHGSFPVGIGVVAIWIAVRAAAERKIDRKNTGIWLLGLVATGINPYGIRNWAEILKQMSLAPWFAKTVAEWIPGYMRADLGTIVLISVVIFGLVKFGKKFTPGYLTVTGITGVMAWGAQRNWPLFAVTAAPIAVTSWMHFENLAAGPESARRWKIFNRLFAAVIMVCALEESYLVVKADKTMEIGAYPQKAVQYLKTKQPEGRIFNEYGWGGYLIWQMPGERYFVDGRMTGFDWKAPPGQSDNAFREYLEVVAGAREATGVFNKYGIRTVILKKPETTAETGFDLAQYLKTKGWLTKYEDETAIILIQSEYGK